MVRIIGSSSKGNCYRYFNIMVDCGMSYKAIQPHLEGVEYISLTHQHGDHLKKSTIKKISEEYPYIFWITPTYLVDRILDLVDSEKVIPIEWKETLKIGGGSLTCFKLYHDVPNSGYLLNVNGFKIFHATDTQHLGGIEAKGCDYYGVECNYSMSKLLQLRMKERTKEEDTQLWLMERSNNSHLSDVQWEEFIEKNNVDGICKKYHKSSRNI